MVKANFAVQKPKKDAKYKGMPGKEEWRGFMSDKTSDVIAGKRQKIEPPKPKFMKRIREGTEDYHENRKLFNKTVNELKDLVAPHLDNKIRTQMENTKIRALGGQAARVKSMPYNLLQQQKARDEVKKSKRDNLQKELGVKLFEGKINGNVAVEQRKKSESIKKRMNARNTASAFQEGKHRPKN